MKTVQKSLRVPVEVAEAIEEEAESSRRDFSSVANDMLEEGIRMRRCPGVMFADGPAGRRARIAGTGLEVWEVIATLRSLDGDRERLRRAYDWLSEAQVRAALGYYAAYPGEIDRQIERNESWTRERLAAQHPVISAAER